MKSAIPLIFEKDTDPKDYSARVFDPALERIVRRSRTRPGRSKTNHAPVTPIAEIEADPLYELFHAAAVRTPPKSRKLPSGIALWLVAIGVAAAVFLTGIFLGRNHAKAPSGLLLESADAHGTLVIRWNYKALQNLDHATLYIDDGGHFITVPLNHSRLVSGYFPYTRKFSLVTVTMVAGDIQAVTSFVAHSPRRQVSHQDPATP
jgi:hypothetical protein